MAASDSTLLDHGPRRASGQQEIDFAISFRPTESEMLYSASVAALQTANGESQQRLRLIAVSLDAC